MENAEIAITRAVEGEQLGIFVSISLSTRTYYTKKHSGINTWKYLKKNFCSTNPFIYRGAVWRMQKSP